MQWLAILLKIYHSSRTNAGFIVISQATTNMTLYLPWSIILHAQHFQGPTVILVGSDNERILQILAVIFVRDVNPVCVCGKLPDAVMAVQFYSIF